MKTNEINITDINKFGILNSEFFTNSSQDERDTILKTSDEEVLIEIAILEEHLKDMYNVSHLTREVKESLGLAHKTQTLYYNPVTKLLVLKRLINRLSGYQQDTLLELSQQRKKINNDIKN